jgi:hypothetical protein
LAEFYAAIDGWKRAHGAEEKPDAPSDEWFDEQVAMLEMGNVNNG